MCKIIQFPIERVKKETSIKVTKLTKEELNYNLNILLSNGLNKEDSLKTLKFLYMSITLRSCQNKLTKKAFDIYWNFFAKKIA